LLAALSVPGLFSSFQDTLQRERNMDARPSPFLLLGTSIVAFVAASDTFKHTSARRICNGMPVERLSEHILGQLPGYMS